MARNFVKRGKGIFVIWVKLVLEKKLNLDFNPQDLYPEYYLIKAGDFNEENIKDTLDEWVYFLKTGYVKDGFKAKGLDKAKHKLAVAKMSPRKRANYERDTKHLHSEASFARSKVINEQLRLKAEEKRKAEIELAVQTEVALVVQKVTEDVTKKANEEHQINMILSMNAEGLPLSIMAKISKLDEDSVMQIIDNQKDKL